ncbi:MAG: tetratricopeptide repeat protein [Planctomycetota bacterium]|nr:tetratricopeptide repeat protein [Planctomycetota bacterium]
MNLPILPLALLLAHLFALGNAQTVPANGAELYQQGKYDEAVKAFRQDTEQHPEAAAAQYNLALSLWRKGELLAAEEAIERYAAMAGGGRGELHHGMLGNLRYEEAKALEAMGDAPPTKPAPPSSPQPGQAAAKPAEQPSPSQIYDQAIDKAKAAKSEFMRAIAASATAAEVARNTQRSLQLIAELTKKRDEAKKREEEQKKEDDKQDDKKDGDKQDDKKDGDKQDDKKDGDKKDDKKDDKQDSDKKDDKKDGDKKDDKQDGEKPGEERPEPKPEEPKPGEQQPPPKPEKAEPRNDAPGEQPHGELSQEQKQRILSQLQQLDQQLQKIRMISRPKPKSGERDW